jgi:hypothetical protein
MTRETRGPIDNKMSETARREDLICNQTAPARVEDVAFEEEKCDPRASHRS